MARYEREVQQSIDFVLNQRIVWQHEEDLVAALKAAYPFGDRMDHPYRVWLKMTRQALLDRQREIKEATKEGQLEIWERS